VVDVVDVVVEDVVELGPGALVVEDEEPAGTDEVLDEAGTGPDVDGGEAPVMIPVVDVGMEGKLRPWLCSTTMVVDVGGGSGAPAGPVLEVVVVE